MLQAFFDICKCVCASFLKLFNFIRHRCGPPGWNCRRGGVALLGLGFDRGGGTILLDKVLDGTVFGLLFRLHSLEFLDLEAVLGRGDAEEGGQPLTDVVASGQDRGAQFAGFVQHPVAPVHFGLQSDECCWRLSFKNASTVI